MAKLSGERKVCTYCAAPLQDRMAVWDSTEGDTLWVCWDCWTEFGKLVYNAAAFAEDPLPICVCGQAVVPGFDECGGCR
jgi:hypothetical protein